MECNANILANPPFRIAFFVDPFDIRIPSLPIPPKELLQRIVELEVRRASCHHLSDHMRTDDYILLPAEGLTMGNYETIVVGSAWDVL
jgi:hypothetical protein